MLLVVCFQNLFLVCCLREVQEIVLWLKFQYLEILLHPLKKVLVPKNLLGKSRKYLLIESTTGDKWRVIWSANEHFSFLASSTIVNYSVNNKTPSLQYFRRVPILIDEQWTTDWQLQAIEYWYNFILVILHVLYATKVDISTLYAILAHCSL
jgi:hypothetical protein